MKKSLAVSALALTFCAFGLQSAVLADGETAVVGYVIDSACLFTKNLKKPVSTECALKCAAAGSPLVIISDDDRVYWPIDNKVPAQGQNERLLKVAGKHVKVIGKVYERGGSKAMVIEKVIPESH